MLDGPLDNRRVIHCRNDNGWQGGVIAAHIRERGKAAHTRHVEIQEQKVGRGICLYRFVQSGQALGLDDFSASDAIMYGVYQRFAKKRMIVSDDEFTLLGLRHSWSVSLALILAIFNQVLDDTWVGQCGGITEVIKIILRYFAQNAAHNFT